MITPEYMQAEIIPWSGKAFMPHYDGDMQIISSALFFITSSLRAFTIRRIFNVKENSLK